jgi:membrane fusion protein, multidrug efflux system
MSPPMDKTAASTRRPAPLFYLAGLLIAACATVGVIGIGAHRSSQASADGAERDRTLGAGPRVRVATVGLSPAVRKLTLQGEARPFAAVTLYAKVAGYLREVRVDKGDHVRAGQIIATIESPELDRQFEGAVADRVNKRANARRFSSLAPAGVVSAQEVEQALTTAAVADATEAAIGSQRGYKILRAPFDGIITARFADPGALLQSAANGQSGALAVVSLAKADTLRVYVYPDQTSAPFVRVGDAATVLVPERPGWSRQGRITRTGGELTTRTRTMLTEVDLDNKDGAILPGSFVQVALQVKLQPLAQVPAAALVLRGDKPFAAVVGEDHRVHYRALKVADDDGQVVRLLDGLRPGETVALDLGDTVEDGATIQVIAPAQPAPH